MLVTTLCYKHSSLTSMWPFELQILKSLSSHCTDFVTAMLSTDVVDSCYCLRGAKDRFKILVTDFQYKIRPSTSRKGHQNYAFEHL